MEIVIYAMKEGYCFSTNQIHFDYSCRVVLGGYDTGYVEALSYCWRFNAQLRFFGRVVCFDIIFLVVFQTYEQHMRQFFSDSDDHFDSGLFWCPLLPYGPAALYKASFREELHA